jgi:hypothetical protein
MAKKLSKTPRIRGYKQLKCKYCEHICDRVDNNADAITCYKCVIQLVDGKILEPRKN